MFMQLHAIAIGVVEIGIARVKEFDLNTYRAKLALMA
jgi:hypothetical protein